MRKTSCYCDFCGKEVPITQNLPHKVEVLYKGNLEFYEACNSCYETKASYERVIDKKLKELKIKMTLEKLIQHFPYFKPQEKVF